MRPNTLDCKHWRDMNEMSNGLRAEKWLKWPSVLRERIPLGGKSAQIRPEFSPDRASLIRNDVTT